MRNFLIAIFVVASLFWVETAEANTMRNFYCNHGEFNKMLGTWYVNMPRKANGADGGHVTFKTWANTLGMSNGDVQRMERALDMVQVGSRAVRFRDIPSLRRGLGC